MPSQDDLKSLSVDERHATEEAIAVVRLRIRFWRGRDLEPSPTFNYAMACLRFDLESDGVFDDTKASAVVDMALAGNIDAQGVLLCEILSHLKDRRPLPTNLAR